MVRLRTAGREDGVGEALDHLFRLDQACFRPGIAWSKRDLGGLLSHPRTISLIAEDGGALVGFAVAELERRAGHIATIDVDPGLRRRGVGRLLMDAIAGRCRDAGGNLLQLEVAVDNEAALAFYRRLGFVETGRIRNFYLDRLDALTMEKQINEGSA